MWINIQVINTRAVKIISASYTMDNIPFEIKNQQDIPSSVMPVIRAVLGLSFIMEVFKVD